MLRASVGLPLLLAIFCCTSYCSGITVSIPGLGQVLGSETRTARSDHVIHQFLNIPYAEPPNGERRFKAPVPVNPWTGVKDVTTEGRPCPQLRITDQLNPGEITPALEDCLSLSVYTKNVNVQFPVMVYIHGGSFSLGRAAEYPPNYLLERDVVLVAIQYRLGALGFLSTMSSTIPGNAAMLDIIMALKWVQDHIAHFGGDPGRVTVFGQSAGAAATSALLYSPLVPPSYFSQVILQSGGATAGWAIDPNPVENAKEIARFAGCNTLLPLEDIERCLMDANVLNLLNALDQHTKDRTDTQGLNNVGGSGMVVGGPTGFLDALPFDKIRSGRVRRDVRIMAGTTKHDGSFMLTSVYDTLAASNLVGNKQFNQYDLIDMVNRVYGIDDHSGTLTGFEVESLFTEQDLNSGNFTQLMAGIIDIAGAIIIKAPVLRDVQSNVRYSEKETYLYSFDYKGEHTRFGYGASTAHYPFEGGTHHSDDNIYLFPYPSDVTNLNAADTLMSEIMLDLWTSFAIDGVPRSNRSFPTWPKVNGPTGPYLHINNPATIGTNFYDEYAVSAHDRTGASDKIAASIWLMLLSVSFILLSFALSMDS
ncbi:glutactin-like [Anopheles ziemanni]|uniref:glutactin-like n=1 Tax=Anopheles coustani TaxID=139045 RepID=UPI00265B6B29|nr:glutactin-like [Anopheles coustani]XP_058170099.1 glutactin-like [Anopheles ziemanni]